MQSFHGTGYVDTVVVASSILAVPTKSKKLEINFHLKTNY